MNPEEPAEKTPPPIETGGGSHPSSVEICANCQRPLTRRGPGGECLRCMMDFALLHEDSGSLIGTGNGRDTGPRLYYGHFEIATDANRLPVELGAGAMGTTYRATDSVLRSSVALKVIDKAVATDPSARVRFLREARAAALLHHPNVASVSHYGEQDGECYYVMELVPGETLEERVRRDGPLSPTLTLEIGIQIARALAAAEAQGIVHRDLKPTNVMLAKSSDRHGVDESPVVKVIDFGLAKAVTAAQGLGLLDTRGAFVGTPAFASPEQFAPAAGENIDTRSDIYSLGVTLWYLLCGKLPFVGGTLTEIHEQQTRRPLPLQHLKAAHVPAPVVSVISSMLAVSPGQRPQSARELLGLLTACQLRMQAGGWKDRPALRWAAVAVLCFAAATVAVVWERYVGKTITPPDISLAVLPFKNLSPAKEDAFFTKGTHDALAANLGRIERLKVTGPVSVKAYPADKPRDLPAIGKALGVTHLLEGSVRREEGLVHIDLHLTDTRNPADAWTGKYDRPLSDEFSLLSEITRTVADRLHVPPSEAESALINLRPTRDPVAWDLYLRSREKPGVYPTADGLRKSAYHDIELLNEAVARDPNFMLAWRHLAVRHDDILTNLQGASPEELAVDHRALAEAALAQARRVQPDAGEVHQATASHYLSVTRDYEQARVECELARRTLPNNSAVESLAGRIAQHQGRWEEAVRDQERAISIDPRDLSLHMLLEEAYQDTRNYPGAIRELNTLESLTPPSAMPTLGLWKAMIALEERADLAPLRAALADLTDAQDNDHDLRDQFGLILAAFDHDATRIRYLLAATKSDHLTPGGFIYPKSWFEGLAARLSKDQDAARIAFTNARADVEKTMASDPRNERNLLLLAMIDAALGRKDEAVSEAQRGCAMTPQDSERNVGPANRCCLAVVYAWTDQRNLALQELDILVSGPAGANMPNQVTFGDFQLNPVWDPLRDDPRFAKLVERLAPAATR